MYKASTKLRVNNASATKSVWKNPPIVKNENTAMGITVTIMFANRIPKLSQTRLLIKPIGLVSLLAISPDFTKSDTLSVIPNSIMRYITVLKITYVIICFKL